VPLQIGEFTLHALHAGEVFKLDPGGMFGVVPKAIWGRAFQTDEQNRIAFAASPLLVVGPGGPIVVDGGCGRVPTPRMIEIFGIRADMTLRERVAAAGVDPDGVRLVVTSHLHFDHVGGLLEPAGAGSFALTFPQATVVVRRGELRRALEPNELTRASYLPEYFPPFEKADCLRVLQRGDVEIAPGVTLHETGGHTRHHQMVIVRSGGETAVYWGDLVPTSLHLQRPNYIAAFDLYPLDTLHAKKRLLDQALAEGWISYFYHDPTVRAARLRRDGDRFLPVAHPM
jgi:glyoxylase-like metal-dependent hydrolase (beta-lactamase superfamily II)